MDIALGAAVRIRRRTIGISQEALAEQCGEYIAKLRAITPTGDLNLLTRMRTPGAIELLAAYELLTPDARSSLVSLLRAVTPSGAGARQHAAA